MAVSPPAARLAERAAAWARGQAAAVRAALVYGSVARGSADAHSDLDLIVVAEPGRRDELWAALAETALLYGWAIDCWAERTGLARPVTPLREIALERLRVG